jgi:hypothetical protein
MEMKMYEKFLERLKEIREWEWNDYDIKLKEEYGDEKGVRHGESALEAIARHMVDVMEENNAMYGTRN